VRRGTFVQRDLAWRHALHLAVTPGACYSHAMTLLDQLGVAFGLATLAGVNLYLTVLVAGLAVRFQWLDLAASHQQLAVLGNPWVIGVAATLFIVEFCADKIPMVDSVWDSLHTLIRPVGGVLLALTALGGLDPVVMAVAAPRPERARWSISRPNRFPTPLQASPRTAWSSAGSH
jgi:hypothetical protein